MPKFAPTPSLDLKWHLTLRVGTVGLVCLIAATLFALIDTYEDVHRLNDTVADAVVRQLDLQLFRIDTNIDVMSRFPDWDPVTDAVMMPGQCVRYLTMEGSIGRASCVAADVPAVPSWLATIGHTLAANADARRPVGYHNKSYGTLVVTTSENALLAVIGKTVSGLLGLTLLITICMAVLQHAAIGRALRPTKDILAGFDRLLRGDLACRLPAFRLVELQRISHVFNTLAAHLEATKRENAALAAKLVEGQEQERLRLARDLHDELAQTLSAISAVAASIETSADVLCPPLQPEIRRLSQLSTGVLASLRTTLQSLRPPEIDDLGLAGSLAALALEHERRCGGRFRAVLEIDGDVRALPPTTASHVYRIVQEALTNVVKHSDARNVRVMLRRGPCAGDRADGDDVLILTIQDDGAPLDMRAVSSGGLGLIGMRERVAALGGELVVGRRQERGYELRALVPIRSWTMAA